MVDNRRDTMTDEEVSLNEAEVFAKQHVREIADEVLEWQDTVILRHGKLRELAGICTRITNTHALSLAQSLAVREALILVSRTRGHETS